MFECVMVLYYIVYYYSSILGNICTFSLGILLDIKISQRSMQATIGIFEINRRKWLYNSVLCTISAALFWIFDILLFSREPFSINFSESV